MLRAAVGWGLAFGILTAAAPLVFRWLPPATVYALTLTLIAAAYVGFAVADGRPLVIAVESAVATAFVVLAGVAVTGSVWLLPAGLAAHGAKDLWQHRTGFVAGTRWWPPFCVATDCLAALVLVVAILLGADLR